MLPLLLALAAPPSLDGTYLFDAAADSFQKKSRDGLAALWSTRVEVAGDTLTMHLFFGRWVPTVGTIRTSGDEFDVTLPEIDLGFTGMPVKHPAGTLKGRWKRDGERVTVCLAAEPTDPRPADFAPGETRRLHLTAVRVPATARPPQKVEIEAVGPDGKPVAGAEVVPFVHVGDTPPRKGTTPTTDAAGRATVPAESVHWNRVTVRYAADNLIAIERLTPYRTAVGPVRVQLQPAKALTGTVECPELAKKPGGAGWLAGYLEQGDTRLAFWSSATNGKFEFRVPPGEYTFRPYGSNVHGTSVPVTVHADRSETAVPPIALKPTRLALLEGEPAPELPAPLGWKGADPGKLADLRGKVVVLDFWGWWCNPCVQSMPELFHLHDKYKDKGLILIGVHCDGGGACPTADKLDAKIADIRARVWKGRDVPYPVALYPDKGSAAGPAEVYGITGYPSYVVIDKQGRVQAGRRVDAALVEKLLAE